MKKMMENKGI